MCLDEGTIAAYLDGELIAEERARVERHLDECAACRVALERARADTSLASGALDGLAAASEREAVDAVAALQRFRTAAEPASAELPGATAASDAAAPVIALARHRTRSRGATLRFAAAAAAVLFVASFAFAPVRGLAAEVLRIFRMEKVQTVSLDSEQLDKMVSAMQQGGGHVDLQNFGEVWIDGTPDAREVSLGDAQKAMDFPIVLPQSLDGTQTLLLQSAMTYKFKLHAAELNSLLRSLGATHLLPADVDGKVFSVTIPAMINANYQRDDRLPTKSAMSAGPVLNGQSVMIAEARSPELVVPDGVDPLAIRDVLINMPIIPQDVRDRLAAITDWQHTLLIPNVGGSAEDIDLNGTAAVAMTAPHRAPADASKQPWSVLWQHDGVVYGVTGDLTKDAAIDIAKQMVR